MNEWFLFQNYGRKKINPMKTKRNILEIYFKKCSVYVDVSGLQNLDTQLKKSEIIGFCDSSSTNERIFQKHSTAADVTSGTPGSARGTYLGFDMHLPFQSQLCSCISHSFPVASYLVIQSLLMDITVVISIWLKISLNSLNPSDNI